jgi:hypothetical protein
MNLRRALNSGMVFGLMWLSACAFSTPVNAQTGSGEVKPLPMRAPRKATKLPPKGEPPAAVSKKAPMAEVTITTKPAGAVVMLDGQVRGTTDGNGVLALRALRPGTYLVTVRHADYRETQQTVQLARGQNPLLNITLNPLPGSLSVTLNVPDADISISNVGSFAGHAEMSLPPGRYHVEATRAGYRQGSQDVDVYPNRPAVVSLQLELLPTTEALTQAEQLIKSGNNTKAILICETILAAQRDNAPANALMGYAYYNTARFGESSRYFDNALALGQTINLPVKLFAKTVAGEGLYTGYLVLRRGAVGFRSNEYAELNFSVLGTKLSELKMEDKKGGRIVAQMGLLRVGQKKEKKEKIYLHAMAAGASGGNIFCSGCQPELQALFQLINHARR